LAEEHQVEDIEGLLAQYAEYLLNKGDLGQAVELYRKAGRTLEAIKILLKVPNYNYFLNFIIIFNFVTRWQSLPKKRTAL
jgi:hypothetical protein